MKRPGAVRASPFIRFVFQRIVIAWPLAVLLTTALIFLPTGLQARGGAPTSGREFLYGRFLFCLPCFGEAYSQYLGQLLSGTLDTSARSHLSIDEVLARGLAVTGTLLALSLLLGMAGGILTGIATFARRRQGRGILWLILTLLGISLPPYLLLLVLIAPLVRLGQQLGVQLILISGGFALDQRLILPVLILALRPAAYFARTTELALEEVTRQDFVRTARAKGLPAWRIGLRHVVPHLYLPWLAAGLAALRFSFAALIVIEALMSWPGLGYAMLNALGIVLRIAPSRAPTLPAEAATVGAVLVLLLLALDTAYALLAQRVDPRLRGGV